MKPTNDIKDFCDQHEACRPGREWALANCKDMAQVWAEAQPEWLVWVACRALDDKTLRLFAVFCARQCQHLLTDQRSRDAIDTAERFAKGEATQADLDAADAADAAARAAWAAADAAARAARAARAAWAEQAQWLRTNSANPFN